MGVVVAQKYNKDQPFADPVVRCDSCQRLFLRNVLRTTGACPSCANRRVRNVMGFESDPALSASKVDEVAQIEKWIQDGKVDPDWFAIFSAVDIEAAERGGAA